MKGGMAYGCGQCMPCLVNRRRVWTHRLMLESLSHTDSAFVTLTYEDDQLKYSVDKTTGELLPTLAPDDLKDFMKRLRAAYHYHQVNLKVPKNATQKIRFYACGEYGEQSDRPHYHLALFGYPKCPWGQSRYTRTRVSCCWSCDLLRSKWGFGNIYSGELTTESASYVAGYVTKKMTSKDDHRLKGRYPEFARMSQGLGGNFMEHVAQSLTQFNLVESRADVPSALRHGSRLLPLGRYLRRRLRKAVGVDEKTPQEVLDQLFEEMSPLRDLAQAISDETGERYGKTLKELVIKQADQAVLNMEARQKIFKSRKTL